MMQNQKAIAVKAVAVLAEKINGAWSPPGGPVTEPPMQWSIA